MKKIGVIKSNRLWSLEGFLNCKKDVSIGDRVLIPAFTVPACEIPGEEIMQFSERQIQSDEAIVINKTEKEIVLIFNHCLFSSAVDFNGQRDFPKTQLAIYLQTKFLQSLNEQGIPAVTCDLPSYDEVFGENRLDFFKSGKNRIGFDFDEDFSVWYWLSTLYKGAASAAYFCYVHGYGNAAYYGAGNANNYVRPRFVLAAWAEPERIG
jgi:hypothetical protein